METPPADRKTPNGPVSAALLAAGIGCCVLGLAVFLSNTSAAFARIHPFGSFASDTALAALAWGASWLALHFLWRKREVRFDRVWIATLAMATVGWVLAFPPVFVGLATQ